MKNIIFFIKIFLQNYKKILISIIFCSSIIFLGILGVSYLEKKQMLIEKFSLGVVVEDNNDYVNIILRILLKRKDFENIFQVEIMSREEGKIKLENKEIPAYIIIPENFTNSIITGENKNIIFVGNEEFIIQYKTIETLIKTGIAFLASSQSGIYSTLDFAKENNINENIIEDQIVLKINLAFGKELLNYNSYFQKEKVFITGDLNIKTHYLYSFIIFFIILISTNFVESTKEIFRQNLLEKCNQLGMTYNKLIISSFLALSIILFIIFIPMYYYFKFKIIFLSLIISSLIIFSSIIFKEINSSEIFIFSLGFVMLFFSGGILPKGLLPNFINDLSFLTINHYFILNENFLYLIFYTIIFVLLNLIILNLYKKVGDKYN